MDRMYRLVEVYRAPVEPEEYSVVAILGSHVEAEQAVNRLQAYGIDLKNCSIVGRENPTGEHVTGYYLAGDRIASWGRLGAFWGGVWGLLGGSAVFLIPGIGPVLMGGTFVTAMVGALEGAVVAGGLSVLGAGFYNIGIPSDSIEGYELAIKGDRFIVIVRGDSETVAKAKEILIPISEK